VKTIDVFGATTSASFASSIPESLGIRTSTSATRGCFASICSSASCPSDARPTTSTPCLIRTSATAVSIAGWSSAITHVIESLTQVPS
jgi:hypothetical protein